MTAIGYLARSHMYPGYFIVEADKQQLQTGSVLKTATVTDEHDRRIDIISRYSIAESTIHAMLRQ